MGSGLGDQGRVGLYARPDAMDRGILAAAAAYGIDMESVWKPYGYYLRPD
jgi:hypothetical protein